MLELAVKRADQGRVDRSALELAHHSAKDLLGLIGDILDMVSFAFYLPNHHPLSPRILRLLLEKLF